MNVIIVDDDHLLRDAIKSVLELCGAHVAGTAWDFISFKNVMNRTVDVCLIDVILPNGDNGFSLAEYALSVSHCNVIMMSGEDHWDGCVLPFLKKPFQANDLLQAILADFSPRNIGKGRLY